MYKGLYKLQSRAQRSGYTLRLSRPREYFGYIFSSGLIEKTRFSFASSNFSFTECVRKYNSILHLSNTISCIDNPYSDCPTMPQANLTKAGISFFSNCNFTNLATDDHGAAVVCTASHSAIALTSCSFSSCISSFNGGAVFSDGSFNTLSVTKCFFKDCVSNSAEEYPGGGGICMESSSSSLSVSSSMFINCKAQTNPRGGGGFFASQIQHSHTVSCRFIFCSANTAGGAIFFWHLENEFFVGDTLFTSNSAGWSGGAIRELSNAHSNTMHIKFSFFTGNIAPDGLGTDFSVQPEIAVIPFSNSFSTESSNRVSVYKNETEVQTKTDNWTPEG